MLIDFIDLIGKTIEVEISRDIFLKGTLLDSGLDIIVMYDDKNQHFLYIPICPCSKVERNHFRRRRSLLSTTF